MAQSHVFAAVGGYYGAKDKGGMAGVFRHEVGGSGWTYALKELETFTVFVNPRDTSQVFAGTMDGVYRSTDSGATFKRANFPDKGVQIWSFMIDPANPKRMLAGGSPVSVYRSEDGGESWTKLPDPAIAARAKMPFACRVMRFAPHPRKAGEIYAVLEVSGVMRSTDGGESWSDCSEHLVRLSEQEPRLRSKLVSDTEAEGMLDGHAIRRHHRGADGAVPQRRSGQDLAGPAGGQVFAVHLRARRAGVAAGAEHALCVFERRRLVEGRRALSQSGHWQDVAALRQGEAARHFDVGQPASD
jgi:hypothetical protein